MDTMLTPELISTVGFPIAACTALFWFSVRILDQQKQAIELMRVALEDNTKAISILTAKMDK